MTPKPATYSPSVSASAAVSSRCCAAKRSAALQSMQRTMPRIWQLHFAGANLTSTQHRQSFNVYAVRMHVTCQVKKTHPYVCACRKSLPGRLQAQQPHHSRNSCIAPSRAATRCGCCICCIIPSLTAPGFVCDLPRTGQLHVSLPAMYA
jgi:hypothetical protein